MILFKGIHNVDVAAKTITHKVIPDDFNSFIIEYVNYATRNDIIKNYVIHDIQTQVVRCITEIVSAFVLLPERTEEVMEHIESCANSIADKLLREESIAQDRIAQMGKQIKKGSLVQSLISADQEDEYFYIVAKVEHSEWYDGERFMKNYGFPSEKKNVWKSAVFSVKRSEEGIVIGAIRVYLDNEANYWAGSFLELDEEKSDGYNTRTAFDAIEDEMKRCIKPQSPRDYYILRNTLIQTMKTAQQLNYPDLVERLIGGNHRWEKVDLDTQPLRRRLSDLPERKKFDRQFTTRPETIIERRRNFFPLTGEIELSIKGPIEDFKNTIKSWQDENGTRYVRVLCQENATYELFLPIA